MASATATDLNPPPQTTPETKTTSAGTSFPPINIGARSSALAQIQARWVENKVKKAHPGRVCNMVPVLSQGDRDKVTPLQQLSQGENAKSLWTGELEAMLEQGDVDMIVHCLKDMPTQLPPGLVIGAVLEREDPRDAFVISPKLKNCTTVASLPAGSIIGTSSIRRTAQLRRLYPNLKFENLRGNLGTRLGKLDAEDSKYNAIILAVAGLKRMGMTDRVTQYLSKEDGGMLYAVGQGALAVEIRDDDQKMKEILSTISCEKTTRACAAERALLRTLEGGCSVPIGIETEWRTPKRGLATGIEPAKDYDKDGKPVEEKEAIPLDEQELHIRTIVVSVDGKDYVEEETYRKVSSVEEAEKLGRDVAKVLVEKGADKILEKISKEKQWAAKQQLEQLSTASAASATS